MLSDDELDCEVCSVPEPKDFRYYADKAEHEIRLSLGRDEHDQILVMSDGAKTRHVWRAEVYARLAAAAPVAKRPANDY